MSKRRKRPNQRHSGGGRVTPKGTQPGSRPGGRSTGPYPGSAGVEQQFAGTGFDLGLGGLDALGGLGEDGLEFDLGIDDGFGEGGEGDPFGPMLEGFLGLDLDEPLMVELWASGLVGEFQDELRRDAVRQDVFGDSGTDGSEDDDLPSEAEFFFDFVGGISRRIAPERPEWAQLLAAITPFLIGPAQAKAELDLEAVDPAVLSFASPLGRGVVEEAFTFDHETDDAHHIGLVARHPGADEPFLVLVFVDQNLGGIAKDILVSDVVDGVRDEARSEGLIDSPLGLAEAHGRVQRAMGRTDMTLLAPVEDDFAGGRPLLERLLLSMPDPVTPPEPDAPTDAELDAIVDAMVADSADRFDDELTPERLRDTALLVTRFMSQQMGRSPVAWSPTRLEILLLDYVPRKVAVPPEALRSLPAEVAALVPAAHRAAGWEDRSLDEALETIVRVEPDFVELISSRESGEG